MVSVAIRVLMKACSANGCGFFGSGGFIYFEIQEGQDTYEFFELLPMLLLGVLGGLMGSGTWRACLIHTCMCISVCVPRLGVWLWQASGEPGLNRMLEGPVGPPARGWCPPLPALRTPLPLPLSPSNQASS